MGDIKYKRLLDALKADILNGKYAFGQPLPSVRALENRFGIARSTIVHAMDELCHQGLISRKQGRGTFVTSLGASRKIGLIVPGVAYSEFYMPFLSAINRLATENGYTLLLGEVYSSEPAVRVRQVRLLSERFVGEGVAGVIYQPIEFIAGAITVNKGVLEVFDAHRIPVVLVASDIVPSPDRSHYDVVGINDFEAGRRLGLHLKDVGVRRMAFLLNDHSNFSVQNRVVGLRSAFGEVHAVREVHFDPSEESSVRRLLSGRSAAQAIVCRSDAVAARLIVTLRDLGKRVPVDVKVAGFNDIGYATSLDLTSVKVPSADIAAFAFRALKERLSDASLPPYEQILPAPLTVRGSTGGKGSRR